MDPSWNGHVELASVRRRLKLLGYPHADNFYNSDESLRTLINFLEDTTFRIWDPEERTPLRAQTVENTILRKYLADLQCPPELLSSEGSTARLIEWLIDEAAWTCFRAQDQAVTGTKSRPTSGKNQEESDGIRTRLMAMAASLQLPTPATNSPTADIAAAVRRAVEVRLATLKAGEVVEVFDLESVPRPRTLETERSEPGFLEVLQHLYLYELRKLQNEVNARIGDLQDQHCSALVTAELALKEDMFKKTVEVRKSNIIRSSEQRKLRDLVVSLYPAAESVIDELLPSKGVDIVTIKLSNKCTVWCVKEDASKVKKGSAVEKYGQPVFFALPFEEEKLVYPTIYSLWVAPDMMPMLITHVEVGSYIISGANLMVRGVLRRKDGSLGGMKRDEPRCIVALENPFPYAVGTCCMSEQEARGQQGVAMKVHHFYRDSLWQLGDRSSPNDGFGTKEILSLDKFSPLTSTSGNVVGQRTTEDQAEPTQKTLAEKVSPGEPDADGTEDMPEKDQAVDEELPQEFLQLRLSEDDTVADPEKALQYAFAVAFRELVQEAEIPIPSTVLYEKYIQRLVPTLNIAEAGFKSFDLFLRSMGKRHFCKTKEVSGELIVTSVNRKNLESLQRSFTFGEEQEVETVEGDAEEGGKQISLEEMDELLERTLLQAIRAGLDPEEDTSRFPMESSSFYSGVIVANRPPGLTIDVKKSSHKKLSVFLKAMAKKKFCTIKEVKGQLLILSVNREHPTVKAYQPYKVKAVGKKPGDTDKTAEDGTLTRLAVVLKPDPEQAKLFADVGANPKGEYTRKEATTVLESYLDKKKLLLQDQKDRRKRTFRIDEMLHRSLSKSNKTVVKPPVGEKILFEDLQELFLSRLGTYYVAEAPGEIRKVRKGEIPKLQVIVEDRQGGRKHVTRCHGVELYGLSAEALAQKCQIAFACSAGTQPMPGKKSNDIEIHLQGNVGKQLVNFLMKEYNIDQKNIELVDKKKKK